MATTHARRERERNREGRAQLGLSALLTFPWPQLMHEERERNREGRAQLDCKTEAHEERGREREGHRRSQQRGTTDLVSVSLSSPSTTFRFMQFLSGFDGYFFGFVLSNSVQILYVFYLLFFSQSNNSSHGPFL